MPGRRDRSPLETQAKRRLASGSVLALAISLGVITGFGELVQLGLDRFYSDFTHRTRDALWMIPAFDAGLFAVVGLVLVVMGRWVHVPWALATGFFAGLGATLILLLAERLHPSAAVVLAVGLGTQTTRLAQNRSAVINHLVRRSWPWLVSLVCLTAILDVGWRALSERFMMRVRSGATLGSPNVLLLVLDAVRAENLSLYGYARPTTPELERLSEDGTVFERAFAPASWTLPSHASMFTGRGELDLDVDWRTRLARRWPTLAEMLYARGYATAGFVANTEYVSWESGLSRGFAHFEDYPLTFRTALNATAFGSIVYPWLRQPLKSLRNLLPARWHFPIPKVDTRPSADEIVSSFLDWIDRDQPTPFFAFLNFMDAHDYMAPDPFRHRFALRSLRPVSRWTWDAAPPVRLTPADVRPKQDAYDGAIAYLDSEIAHLFRELERRRLLGRTLVIVTADHGEEFAEHGLVSHGNSLYRLSLHVPLVVWFPGRVPGGQRVTESVSLRNLAATVLDVVDSGRPSPLPGRSLARFWTIEDTTSDSIIASVGSAVNLPNWYPASRGALISIALDGWRYIRNQGDGTEELYDFEHDLLERWNLVGTIEGNRLLPRYRAAAAALVNGPGHVGEVAESFFSH